MRGPARGRCCVPCSQRRHYLIASARSCNYQISRQLAVEKLKWWQLGTYGSGRLGSTAACSPNKRHYPTNLRLYLHIYKLIISQTSRILIFIFISLIYFYISFIIWFGCISCRRTAEAMIWRQKGWIGDKSNAGRKAALWWHPRIAPSWQLGKHGRRCHQ